MDMRSHPPTHVPPLALILLLAFCALPAVFYLLSDRASDLPEDNYIVSDGAAGSPLSDLPMRGLTYGPDGRASLLQAPARILAMDRERDNTSEARSVPDRSAPRPIWKEEPQRNGPKQRPMQRSSHFRSLPSAW
ncbi:hypothetical protein G7A66_10360 [Altererythrobacter sp. SALINAS58]|uniref:hypothetical protein n=1 Tax=Alteripontixanthobacter muriae TaxID=2705546 RepID=UPI001576E8F1|nr:hypothetical protein [Alteripontixanthobacter muriae]NTZ43474.1 hypothetical protein [Alteripontixanthobacter muriae]